MFETLFIYEPVSVAIVLAQSSCNFYRKTQG